MQGGGGERGEGEDQFLSEKSSIFAPGGVRTASCSGSSE